MGLKRNLNNFNKKGIVSDYLPWLMIALAILAISLISVFVLKTKGISVIDKIKDLFTGP